MKLLNIYLLCVGLLGAQTSNRAIILADVDAPNTPTDSPGGGTYSSTQSVTLSDPTSSLILYTTNGSTPACPATGTLYTGAISVAVTTTIKAIGCNGVAGSGVLTSVYTISAGGTCCTVGTAVANEDFGGHAVTLGATNKAAGAGIFCIASWDGFTGSVTFTNTASDTWIPLDTWNDGNSFQRFSTGYVKSSNGNASDAVTATLSLTATQVAASCIDFTGQDSTTPLDQHTTGATSGSNTSVTSSTFTTTAANELIVGGLGAYASGRTWTAGNIGGAGATIPSGATSTFKFISLEYLLVTTTQSSITADATVSASTAALGIGVATFK